MNSSTFSQPLTNKERAQQAIIQELQRRGTPIPAHVEQKLSIQRTLSFPQWLPEVSPSWRWDWPHLVAIQQALDGVTRGTTKKLMLYVPPRHGKSEAVTVRYSAWRLEKSHDLRIIVGAYNQFLANKFSRKIRRIARSRIALSTERTAVEEWE